MRSIEDNISVWANSVFSYRSKHSSFSIVALAIPFAFFFFFRHLRYHLGEEWRISMTSDRRISVFRLFCFNRHPPCHCFRLLLQPLEADIALTNLRIGISVLRPRISRLHHGRNPLLLPDVLRIF